MRQRSHLGIRRLLGAVLVVFPALAFPQFLPDTIRPILPQPARPIPGPPTLQPEFPVQELPSVEVKPSGEEAPPGASKVFVVLRDIVIEGATIFNADVLRDFYAGDIGKKISVAQVFAIAENIQEKYRSDGYILTRVVVPQQSVSDGVFTLQVVEGFISGIKIEGEIGAVRARVEATLNNLVEQKPVSEQDIERYLLLANDIPGIHAVGFLRSAKGEEVGASELVVQVDRKPFEGYAFVNNRGSKYTGPSRFSLMVRENSATFLGEQIEGLFFNTLFNNEQRFGGLSYRQLLNSEGLQLDLSAGYGPSEPGNGLEEFEVETAILTVTGTLNYPLIRARKHNLYLNGGFQSIDETVDSLGTAVTRDRVRVLFADLAYDFRDSLGGQSTVGLGLRQGLDALGASEAGDRNLSRAEAVPDFTTLNFSASRYQPLWDSLGLYLGAAGQYSFNPLFNSVEFKVGGERFGRGYNPVELTGDSGLGLTAEFQYTLPGPFSFWQSLQGYAFYDLGVVWNQDQNADGSASLMSSGFGVRNQLLKNLFVDLEVAWPLTRKPDTFSKNPRFLFQVLTRF